MAEADFAGKWVASGKQRSGSYDEGQRAAYEALMKFRKQHVLSAFSLERMVDDITFKHGIWTVTTHLPGKIPKKTTFRVYSNERDRFGYRTHFARDGSTIAKAHANFRVDADGGACLLITANEEEDGIELETTRTVTTVRGAKGDFMRTMEMVVTWRRSSLGKANAKRGRSGGMPSVVAASLPVELRVSFVEASSEAEMAVFDGVRGFGAAVLGGIVLGPPGMVAAGITYIALRSSNVLKGPDADKLNDLISRKERLDARLNTMNIDMGAIEAAASKTGESAEGGQSSFVAFSKKFLENNKAIDELAAKIHEGGGDGTAGGDGKSAKKKKLSPSEEAGISAKLDLLLRRMDELEEKLTTGLEGVEQHLDRQDVMLKGIGGDVQRALHCLYRVNNVVTALADDELTHPRLVLLLPPAASKKKLMSAGKWFNPKYWFSSEMRLHVLCAHSLRPVPLSNGEDGYPVHKPKEWLVKAAPAIKATLVVLRVALMAARVTTGLPLPIPSFGIGADEEKLEAFSDALAMFDGALDSALSGDAETLEALKPLEKVRDEKSAASGLSAAEQAAVHRITANSYRALGQWLNRTDPGLTQLPMQKAVAPDGHVDWVANENVKAWRKGASFKPKKKKKKKGDEDDDGAGGGGGSGGGGGAAASDVVLRDDSKGKKKDLSTGSDENDSKGDAGVAKCSCVLS